MHFSIFRQWVVVTAKPTQVAYGNYHPKLVTIVPRVQDDELILSAPGMENIAIPINPSYNKDDLIGVKYVI